LFVQRTKDHDQVAAPGLLEQLVAHREIGVHTGNSTIRFPYHLASSETRGIKGKATDHKQVEAKPPHCLFDSLLDLTRFHGAVLGSDGDGNVA
jgi:hypothetical protein